MIKTPYFLTNTEWFKRDKKQGKIFLTELGKSIPKVVESYNEFYGIDK